MGIDVSVNLNAFNFRFSGDKRVREVGDQASSLSTNFYKSSQCVFTNVSLDIAGALFGLLVSGLVSIVWSSNPQSYLWSCFVQEAVGKNGRYF